MMDIRVPYPMHQSWLPENIGSIGINANMGFDLDFYISPDGCTDSVIFIDGGMEKLDTVLLGAIRGMDFYPALHKGDSISFVLPAHLEISRRGAAARIELRFPYNPHLNHQDNDLLYKTLSRNGYTPARVIWVPSYYCISKDEVPQEIVPFAIFRISLSEAGLLKDIETVATNNRSCAGIVSTVMLYSRYQPAEYRGEAIASDFFVTVRNFRQVSSPTSEWPPQNNGKAGYLYNYLRIESNPFLDSNVVYPIPTNLTGDVFHYVDSVKIGDSIKIPVLVNPSGRAVVSGNLQSLTDYRLGVIRDILSKLQFIPLQNLSGRKLGFAGTLTLYFDFSKKIRIRMNWYSDEAQGGSVNMLGSNGLEENEESR